MAISLVGTVGGGAANGGNVTLTLPAGMAQDDLVCVFGGFSGASGAGVSTAGYTENTEFEGNTAVISFSYKKMGASPDASVTCLGSGLATDAVAYVAMVFRGVDTSTPIDATTITTTGSGVAPNSASITTVTNGAAVISAASVTIQDATVTAPTGYGDAVNGNATDLVPYTTAAAWKTVTSAGAENPGSWSDWSLSSWAALTVALRPANAGTFGNGALNGGASGATVSFVGINEGVGPFAMTGSAAATFAGGSLIGNPLSATGSAAVSFVGTSVSNQPQPFSMTGTGTALFVGALAGAGALATTGVATINFSGSGLLSANISLIGRGQAQWVGATSKMESVREDIRSKGAATVNM